MTILFYFNLYYLVYLFSLEVVELRARLHRHNRPNPAFHHLLVKAPHPLRKSMKNQGYRYGAQLHLSILQGAFIHHKAQSEH